MSDDITTINIKIAALKNTKRSPTKQALRVNQSNSIK
jgi:hypothetical protein